MTIKEIPYRCFKDNSSIERIKFPKFLKKIGKDALYNCKNLLNITLTQNTIPATVEEIGESAFSSSFRESSKWHNSIYLPPKIRNIAKTLCYNSNIHYVYIYSTVLDQDAGEACFKGCVTRNNTCPHCDHLQFHAPNNSVLDRVVTKPNVPTQCGTRLTKRFTDVDSNSYPEVLQGSRKDNSYYGSDFEYELNEESQTCKLTTLNKSTLEMLEEFVLPINILKGDISYRITSLGSKLIEDLLNLKLVEITPRDLVKIEPYCFKSKSLQ